MALTSNNAQAEKDAADKAATEKATAEKATADKAAADKAAAEKAEADSGQTYIVAKDNDGNDVRMKSEDHADWERRQLADRK